MAGAINYGDAAAREVSERVGGVFADDAALKALAPNQRVNGMLCVVEPASLWIFDASSSASAGATVLVPDSGTGRWVAAVIPA